MRPLDFVLLPLAIRRYRCVYCRKDQLRWLLPRSVRWALAVALLGTGYLLSAGPFDWLHANDRMSETTHTWLAEWLYFPINRWLDSPLAGNWSITRRYVSYRNLWLPQDRYLDPRQDQEHTVARPLGPPPAE